MDDRVRRKALANFLRTRRARLSPPDVHLPDTGRRRTPGLRREEVAHLAHVGVSWYTSLEQGRDIGPSREVLQNLAQALRLTVAEQRHFFFLAGLTDTPAAKHAPTEKVSPVLLRVLEDLNPNPAYIMDRRWNYIAWNHSAQHVLGAGRISPPYDYNILWRMFSFRPEQQDYAYWSTVAQKVLGEFRAESAPYIADDEWLQQLIADLEKVSPEFHTWWPRQDVLERSDGNKVFEHPHVGTLYFEHTTLQASTDSDLKIMIFRPRPETDTADKVRQLLKTPE